MSALPLVPLAELEEIPCPYVEPRIAFQANEPRKLNNLTLIDGKTFLSTSVAGDIAPFGAPDIGFFHDDTRFLSGLELKLEGHRAVVLSSATEKSFVSQIELTTGNITLRETFDLPENSIHLRREQLLAHNVFFDYLTFENFNQVAVEFTAELRYAADFMDVFQVRGTKRGHTGQYYRPYWRDGALVFAYKGLDGVRRQTCVRMSPKPSRVDETGAFWRIALKPAQRVRLETDISAILEGDEHRRLKSYDFAANLKQRRQTYEAWRQQSTSFDSSHDEFDEALNTAEADFHALQIPDGSEHIIAAGIPWFATIFGRDSIIAAYQSLLLNPRLAADTLRVLARYQGTKIDDWRDEEPGKILHEHRVGEMTRAGEMPFGPYYGSVDSTPLFLVLASEYYAWTADEGLIRDILPAIYRALQWIDRYGDRDGDGFVEYQRRSERGLLNQGWKDSWDANLHRDGQVAETPIALVEVQGYVFDAKYRMSRLLRAMGDADTAARLKREAAELARRIDKDFWVSGNGFYAMGLDARKKKLEVVSSNPGHLLFSRVLRKDRARTVANRLMQPDMHSGWGWRTMAKSERVYNPLSYHRGSVWPHDNSLIAHGMALYGFTRPALHTLTTLFQTAATFRNNRLPELFCGLQRQEADVPVHYPVSCSPQAWASGAFFLMLTAVLGIRPSAPDNELNIINPALPEWLNTLEIRNLRIGRSRVGLDFLRRGERTYCNVVDVEGDPLLVNVAFKK
jgi:glycogen debranching enzyme